MAPCGVSMQLGTTEMTSHSSPASSVTVPKPSAPVVLLTPKEAAKLLKVSLSWLAKARMRGDGPPYVKVGSRAIRYIEAVVIQWMKGRQRLSTSEQ